ncbi:MAG: C45 family autoproteolytic acyltransferase/hydrolase, partial [Actinomycetota bacterium]
MGDIRVVRAQGDAMARGIQLGKELEDLVQASIGFYHRYLDRRGVSSEQLQDLLTPYLLAAETSYPESMNMLKGMSVGAMVPILELFAINAFEELEPLLESPEGELLFLQRKEGYVQAPVAAPSPPPERCSSLSVRLPHTTLLAHNEHWLAGDLGNVAVVIDVPEDGRVPVASPTVVCCLPAVGLNAHGGGQGIGSLTAIDDGVGVPRVLVSRSSLEARSRADAVARAAMLGRAGGYGHVYAFPDDAFAVETTGREHRVIDHDGPHTNHYLDPELAALAPPPSEGSRARLTRMQELIDERHPSSP